MSNINERMREYEAVDKPMAARVDTPPQGVRGALCNIGLCTGGIVCEDGKATCAKCGYVHHYSKVPNAKDQADAA